MQNIRLIYKYVINMHYILFFLVFVRKCTCIPSIAVVHLLLNRAVRTRNRTDYNILNIRVWKLCYILHTVFKSASESQIGK
jgi:hypothetical protein